MIVCVSLNPALDLTYRLDSPLQIGGTNRVAHVAVRPGGKALGLARIGSPARCGKPMSCLLRRLRSHDIATAMIGRLAWRLAS